MARFVRHGYGTDRLDYMKIVAWLLGALGWLLVVILRELAGELLGEAAYAVTAPVRRPVWRAFVNARWPWPLLVVSGLGAAGSAGGLWLFKHYEDGWRAGAGVTLFLAGAFVALIAPFVWRDARRVRAQQRPRR